MSVTPGTIAEFDIVLSVSEEAINKQLRLLYEKKIDDDDLPIPTEVEGAAPAAQAKYLINRDIEIHIKDEDGELDMQEGLSAHIKCPKISFTDVPAPNDFRTARMSFTFERVEGAANPDSTYTRWVKGKTKSDPINGWTMSWLVTIGRKDINNVMEELITPNSNNDDSTKLHPKTVKELQKVVDSRCFLVSSVFCLFEATQMANTFELRDENGNLTNSKKEADFMLLVTKYFTGLKVRPGTVTPDNPFVLGYGISQKVPDIREINPNADPDLTPRFFIPKKFQMTTTPGSVQPDGTKFTNGTLNFCMLTHREYWPGTKTEKPGREERLVNPEQNRNAGILPQTFFDTTRTSAHDGVMGFCKDLILDQFICEVMGKSFYADPSVIFNLQGGVVEKDPPASSWAPTYAGHPPSWTYGSNFNIKGREIEGTGPFKSFYKASKWSAGHSKVTVSIESDLLDNPSNVTHLDAQRRSYITLISDTEIRTMHETQSLLGGILNETWTEQYLATLYMKYKVRLILSAGSAGVWDVSVDYEKTVLPTYGSGSNHLDVKSEHPNDRFGSFVTGQIRNKVWSIFGSEEDLKWRMQQVSYSGDAAVEDLQNKLKAMLSSMQNRIIMPAGDVFMFKGIDIDGAGNLYSHVSYAQGAENAKRT